MQIVVKNLVGEDVIPPASYPEPVLASTMREVILQNGQCSASSRFKLLCGSQVLHNTDILKHEEVNSTVVLTMVTLPPARISEEAEAIVIPVKKEHQLHVDMFDLRSHKEETLVFRYFLDHDGDAHLGVLAVELAPMIGANVSSMAQLALVHAIYDGESRTETLQTARRHVRLWRVVGGGKTGGIIARIHKTLQSEALEPRLATGALVEELALEGGRLHYKLVSGEGPATGWVSLRLQEKILLAMASEEFEIFRAVILVGQLPKALVPATSAWRRHMTRWNKSFVDVGLKITERLDEIVLATQGMHNNGKLLDAVRRAQASVQNWWSLGI